MFTLDEIPKDTFIAFYTGEVIHDDDDFGTVLNEINQKKRDLTYGFDIHDWSLEAHSIGNLTRFANHADK